MRIYQYVVPAVLFVLAVVLFNLNTHTFNEVMAILGVVITFAAIFLLTHDAKTTPSKRAPR
jgi:hypothetical protein